MLTLYLAASCVLLWVGKLAFQNYRTTNKSRQYGCLPPAALPSRDPVLGSDIFLEGLRDRKAHTRLKTETSRFERSGVDTYSMKSMGRPEIHTKNGENFRKSLSSTMFGVGPMRGIAMSPFCGYSFLTTDGKIWEQSRARLKPSFARRYVTDMTAFDPMLLQLIKRLPVGETVDFQDWILRMFVDVSQMFIVGRTPGAFRESEGSDAPINTRTYLNAFNKSIISLGMRMMLGPFRFILPKKMAADQWTQVFAYIDHFIDRALSEQVSKEQQDKRKTTSILQIVSEQTDDRVEIRNQVLQGLLAAQDTIATLISNTVFRLTRRPDVWAQLRAEVLKYDPESETVEALRQNQLVKNILNEVLRLHPLFPRIARIALEDTILPAGGGPDYAAPIFIPKGTRVIHSFAAAHRDPKIFGPDIDTFKPDRWLEIDPSPWQFMPFGGGLRQCLGQNKALDEASYTLWKLARTYEKIEPRQDCEYEPQSRLVTQNVNGCKVGFFLAKNE